MSIPSTVFPRSHLSPGSSSEFAVSRTVKILEILLYLFLNLAMTFLNKAVLARVVCPWLLTTTHSLASVLGCLILLWYRVFSLSRLTTTQWGKLAAFSHLYLVNIALSNISLHEVTVPFHQLVRATGPVFVVVIYRVGYSETFGASTYLSLIPVISGVGLVTYGDYGATTRGFCLTLLGSSSAALKTVVANRLQTGERHLTPLEVLLGTGLLASVQGCVCAWLSGEMRALPTANLDARTLSLLFCNAVTAVALNVASFTANRDTGALMMAVVANVKQILAIVVSSVFFGVHIGLLNCLGILLTLVGGMWHAKVGLDKRKKKNKTQSLSSDARHTSLPQSTTDVKS